MAIDWIILVAAMAVCLIIGFQCGVDAAGER